MDKRKIVDVLLLIGLILFVLGLGYEVRGYRKAKAVAAKKIIDDRSLIVDDKKSTEIIDINTATLSDLDTLPGIGPAIGQRIIDYRETSGKFKNIHDIVNVKGIGEKTYEKFKDRIKI